MWQCEIYNEDVSGVGLEYAKVNCKSYREAVALMKAAKAEGFIHEIKNDKYLRTIEWHNGHAGVKIS